LVELKHRGTGKDWDSATVGREVFIEKVKLQFGILRVVADCMGLRPKGGDCGVGEGGSVSGGKPGWFGKMKIGEAEGWEFFDDCDPDADTGWPSSYVAVEGF
jgi:hypothetical protein